MPVPEARVEIQIDGAWADVTDDVKGATSLIHTRGRSGEGASVDRASVQLTLKSPDGKYYPRHPMSPNYGKLGRNTPLRHSSSGDIVHLRVGDTSTGRLSTPDHSSLDITGDLDVRVDAAFDEWPTTGNPLKVLGKWTTTPSQRSWLLTMWQSRITLYWSPDGTAQLARASDVIPPLPYGQRIAIRATLDVNNGAAGRTVTFYTAPTLAGPWTMLGVPGVTAGTTNIFASTAPLEAGGVPGSPFDTAAGNIYAAEVRNGIGGTVVASPDLTAQAAGASGFTDSAGRTWSTADGAEITSHRIRAVVEVPTWAPRWTVDGTDMDVAIQGAGVLRRLSQGQKALQSTLRRRVPSYDPLAYWPMEDEPGATAAFSPIEGVAPLRVTGVSFGQDASLAGSSALPTIEAGGRMVGSVPAPVAASTQWSVHMVYTLDGTAPVSNGEFLAWRTSGTVRRWRILQRTGVGTIEGYDADGDLVVNQPVSVDDEDVLEGWNRYQFRVSETGGTVDWRLSWININGDAGGFGSTYSGTAGRVTQIETTVGAPVAGLRVGHIAVFPVELTDAYSFADHGFTGETAGARALRLTAEESLPFTLVGDASDTTPMGPQRPGTLLSLLLQCEASDGGILYEDPGRLGLVYRTRATLYNQEPTLVLSYSQINQPFEPVDDDSHIRNDVTRSRIDGSSARVVAETGPLSVQAPPLGVGIYDDSQELSLATDDQPEQIAAWAVHRGTWDEARYKQVRVLLHKHPDLIPAVSNLHVGDLIRITDLPAYLPPGPVDLIMEGYRDDQSNGTWEITFNCSPAGPWTVGVVEDTVLGRADTDGSELASAVDESDTTLSVATTAGPVWVPDQRQYPFDLTVGGEVVTAAAAGSLLHGNALLLDGLAGWSGLSSTIALDTTIVHTGLDAVASIRVTPSGASSASLLATDHSPVSTVTPGASYTMSAWVYAPGGWSDLRILADWYNAADVMLSTTASVAISVPAGVWTYITLTATAPASASRAGLRARIGASPTAADLSYWWALRMVPDDTVTAVSPQTMTVIRARNGITKPHAAGTPLSLTHPMRAAL
ncbi:hypothetical protein YUYDRAFT_02075 [Streptomyces sp. ScaeMP-e48]|nr:hypothetical protein YUYDRAFT_02075 [Streptomyces sp. ScaeMP-e48]